MTFLIVLWACNRWHRWTPMTMQVVTLRRDDRPPTTGICIAEISNLQFLKFQRMKFWNLNHRNSKSLPVSKNLPLDWGRFHCSEQPGLVSTGGARCWCLHGSWRLQCHCCQSYQLLDSCWRDKHVEGTSTRPLCVWCSKWDKLIAFQQQADSKELPINFICWMNCCW